eukprot:gene17760-19533_t
MDKSLDSLKAKEYNTSADAVIKNGELYEELQNLTIHGPSRIASANSRWQRLVWTALLLCSVGSLIYVLVYTVSKHREKEVYVTQEKKISPTMSMPAITFCDTNVQSLAENPPPQAEYLPLNCSQRNWKFKNKINQKYFNMACKLFMANYSKHNMIIGQDAFKFPSMFTLTPSLCLCFTLNKYSNLKQAWSGERNGLQMVLHYDENEYEGSKQNERPLEDRRSGLLAFIHDPEEQLRITNSVYLSPGYHTHVGIEKSIKIRQPSPFKANCTKNGNENIVSIIPGKYTVENCYYSCKSIAYYNACQYVPPTMRVFMPESVYPNLWNFTSYKDYLHCKARVWRNFNYKKCNCSLPCREAIYKTKVSQNPWPQRWQADMFSKVIAEVEREDPNNRNYSIGEIRQKLMQVSFYYDELSEIVYEEKELYPIVNIFSDIGGQMGLLLGASCMSLIEVVCLLVRAIAARFLPKRKGAQISNLEPYNKGMADRLT